MTTTIVLISCGKTKLNTSTPVQARNLYQGELFKKSLAYARTLTDDNHIYILSAKYLLITLYQQVLPYEKTLNKMPAMERRIWGKAIGSELQHLALNYWDPPIEFVLLAGTKYFEPLEKYLRRIGIISRPLKGLGIGSQLGWLKART